MRFATCFAVALATVVGGGVLLANVAGASTPRPAEVAAPTTPPQVPTLATTVPLPTQSTSLSPVTAPATTAPPINDDKATRLVNRVVAVLAGLGVLVALLTIWYWRSTKPVPLSLEGVELMSTRKWLRGKPDKRVRLLAEYHAKRGLVPEESIARVGAPTVRVGAAVAAPAVAPVAAPAVAPVMASTPARGPAPEAVNLGELTDEPPVLVGEDDELAQPSGIPEPSTPPPSPAPAAAVPQAAVPQAAVPQATSPATSPARAAPRAGANGDEDSVFTVVARRPRATDDDPPSETP